MGVMSIRARFRLDQVSRSRAFYKEPGAEEAQSVEGAFVQLNGVQGEPFGSATPSAHLEMLIVNPAAAAVFFNAHIGQEFDLVISPAKG